MLRCAWLTFFPILEFLTWIMIATRDCGCLFLIMVNPMVYLICAPLQSLQAFQQSAFIRAVHRSYPSSKCIQRAWMLHKPISFDNEAAHQCCFYRIIYKSTRISKWVQLTWLINESVNACVKVCFNVTHVLAEKPLIMNSYESEI